MQRNRVPDSMWRNPLHFIAFGFGSGAAPIAPGTFGTLFAIPIYLLLSPLPLPFYLFIVAVITILSIWISHRVAREIDVHDHPGMCLDEFVGYLITMINAPKGWVWVLIGFGLFRLFDIWKPWPIRWIDQHVGGGFGIIFDDVLAAIFAFAFLQGFAFLFHSFS